MPSKSLSLNSTALRVFKVLEWLIEKPHSVDDLNKRFVSEPEIGRSTSEDSIWLYINALKMLGCEIGRPREANNYKYILHHHPFSSNLTSEDLDLFINIKPIAQKNLTYKQILTFDSFFKRLFQSSYSESRKQLVKSMFTLTRSLDYEAQKALLTKLNISIETTELLFIGYQSASKGLEHFYFLPEFLHYESGIIYIHGSRLKRESLVKLRVDRIKEVEHCDEPAILQELKNLQSENITVKIKFTTASPRQVRNLHLGIIESYNQNSVIVKVKTRDTFMLKQQLLECGYYFKILSPESFKADVLEELKGCLTHYKKADSINRVYQIAQ